MILPLMVDAVINEIIKGVSTMPAWVAERPITPWEKIGMYTIAPNMAMVVKKRQQTDTTKTLFLKRPNESMGFVDFLSIFIKMNNETRLMINEPMICQETSHIHSHPKPMQVTMVLMWQ